MIHIKDLLQFSNNPPLSMDFSQFANGPVPGLIGDTWWVLNGKLVNNPDLGPELYTNPGFEGAFSSGLAAGWAKDNVAHTATEETTLVYSGAKAQRITSADNTKIMGLAQVAPHTVGDWMLMTSRIYSSVPNVAAVYSDRLIDGYISGLNIPATTYTKILVAARASTSGASTNTAFSVAGKAVNAYTIYDDCSIRVEALASLAGLKRMPTVYGSVSATCIRSGVAFLPFGVCMNVSSDRLYGVYVYYHLGTIRMDKCVNGTWTNLISVTTAYGDDKSIKIERIPGTNTFRAWYGVLGSEVQIGADITIADAGIITSQFGGVFDTSPGLNTFGKLIYGLTPGEITFNGDWANGLNGAGASTPNTWKWSGAVSADRLTLVTDVLGRFPKSVRFEVRNGDEPNAAGEWCQLMSPVDKNGVEMYENDASGTKYFGIGIRLNDPFPDNIADSWSVIYELHPPDVWGGNPSFQLNTYNPGDNTQGWCIHLKGGDREIVTTATPHNFSTRTLNKGAWTYFIFKIKFSTADDGSVDVWRKDAGDAAFANVLSVANVPTLQFIGSEGPEAGEHYWRVGPYRRNTETSTQILHVDGVVVGTTYDVVLDTFK